MTRTVILVQMAPHIYLTLPPIRIGKGPLDNLHWSYMVFILFVCAYALCSKCTVQVKKGQFCSVLCRSNAFPVHFHFRLHAVYVQSHFHKFLVSVVSSLALWSCYRCWGCLLSACDRHCRCFSPWSLGTGKYFYGYYAMFPNFAIGTFVKQRFTFQICQYLLTSKAIVSSYDSFKSKPILVGFPLAYTIEALPTSGSKADKIKHHGANPRRVPPLAVSTCYVRMRCDYVSPV